MPYTIIQPPFTLEFREMSKKELKDYFAWFQNTLPSRIEELSNAVKRSSGFELWQADYTPESLNRLGEWFATQVETRPRTEEEIKEILDRSSIPLDVPKNELTNRTFSLAIDIGMYLSQVFLNNHDALRWDQQFGGKKNVDYGQPVLIGFGSVPFNPVNMAVTLAYSLANNRKTGKRLRELYDIWVNMISE